MTASQLLSVFLFIIFGIAACLAMLAYLNHDPHDTRIKAEFEIALSSLVSKKRPPKKESVYFFAYDKFKYTVIIGRTLGTSPQRYQEVMLLSLLTPSKRNQQVSFFVIRGDHQPGDNNLDYKGLASRIRQAIGNAPLYRGSKIFPHTIAT